MPLEGRDTGVVNLRTALASTTPEFQYRTFDGLHVVIVRPLLILRLLLPTPYPLNHCSYDISQHLLRVALTQPI
jgi:hypothetical protein